MRSGSVVVASLCGRIARKGRSRLVICKTSSSTALFHPRDRKPSALGHFLAFQALGEAVKCGSRVVRLCSSRGCKHPAISPRQCCSDVTAVLRHSERSYNPSLGAKSRPVSDSTTNLTMHQSWPSSIYRCPRDEVLFGQYIVTINVCPGFSPLPQIMRTTLGGC